MANVTSATTWAATQSGRAEPLAALRPLDQFAAEHRVDVDPQHEIVGDDGVQQEPGGERRAPGDRARDENVGCASWRDRAPAGVPPARRGPRGVWIAPRQQEGVGGQLRLVPQRRDAEVSQTPRHPPDDERGDPAQHRDDEGDAAVRRCDGGAPARRRGGGAALRADAWRRGSAIRRSIRYTPSRPTKPGNSRPTSMRKARRCVHART